MVKGFTFQFLSPAKVSKHRNAILHFHQEVGENFHEAWFRFKGSQRRCPYHGLREWLIFQTLYMRLQEDYQGSLDIASGGSFMGKTLKATKHIIKKWLRVLYGERRWHVLEMSLLMCTSFPKLMKSLWAMSMLHAISHILSSLTNHYLNLKIFMITLFLNPKEPTSIQFHYHKLLTHHKNPHLKIS